MWNLITFRFIMQLDQFFLYSFKFVDVALRGLKVISINKITLLASSAYQSCHLLPDTPPHPAPPSL